MSNEVPQPDRLRRILRDLDVAYSEVTWPQWPGICSFVIEAEDGVTGLAWCGPPSDDEDDPSLHEWEDHATLAEYLLEMLASLRASGRRDAYAIMLRLLNAALRWEEPDAD